MKKEELEESITNLILLKALPWASLRKPDPHEIHVYSSLLTEKYDT